MVWDLQLHGLLGLWALYAPTGKRGIRTLLPGFGWATGESCPSSEEAGGSPEQIWPEKRVQPVLF